MRNLSPFTPTTASIPVDRVGQRQTLQVQGRITWRDARGTLRFASVITRNVSETDAFVECQAPTSIPLHRLVHFQVERTAHNGVELPDVLRRGKLLSAVTRVGPYMSATGTPQGYALRLLVEPTPKRPGLHARAALAIAN
jgi:uncharacterized protein (UPF0248 family)